MVNGEKLETSIKKEINMLRNLGENSRAGSDHLYFRTLIRFKLDKVKEFKHKEKLAFEVICKYDIYTETEFLHSPEMDEHYTELYKDKFTFDKEFNILEIKDMRKKK